LRARFVAIFAIALVARLVAAASCPLYVDESFAYFMSRHGFAAILDGSRPDNNPPFWYFVLHPIAVAVAPARSAGLAAFILRLPSCVLGAFAAPLAWAVGRRFGERVGVGAGLLVALAYTSWLVDAQTRAYGLLSALAMLGLWLALEEESGSRRMAMIGASVALPLAHYVGWLIDLGLVAACLRCRRWKAAGAFSAGVAVGAAWMAYAMSNALSGLHSRTLSSSGVGEAFDLVGFLSGALLPLQWPPLRGSASSALPILISLGVTALALLGLRSAALRDRDAAWTVGLFVLFPLMGVLGGALCGVQSYQNRYLVSISGAVFVLIAAVRPPPVARLLVGALLLVNLATLSMFPGDRYLWNQDWRGAAEWIQHREQAGDVILASLPYSLVGLDFYYHPGQMEVAFSSKGAMDVQSGAGYDGAVQMPLLPSMLGDALRARLAGHRVFLVLNQLDPASGQAILAWMGARSSAVDAWQASSISGWGNITVVLFGPPSPAGDGGPRPSASH
jgi:hypothetical protein